MDKTEVPKVPPVCSIERDGAVVDEFDASRPWLEDAGLAGTNNLVSCMH
jgi:hypothetical protein